MMKHVAKKGVALLLTLCMILTVFPVNVLADSRTEKSYVIPQFVMETTASSQETVSDENSSKNAIDGDSGTIWHTQWSGVGASAPHWIKVDLKKNYTVSGLTYLPRQDDSMNGQVTKYEIFYSSDDVNYTSAISGNWENNKEEKIADFAPVSARYIKLQSAGTFMSCAELNIKTVDDMYSNLWEAWREAEKLAGVAVIGDQPEQYPKDAVDALYAAIKEAKLAIADSELDEETASAVTEMLKNAMIVFRNAVNCYTWDQFSDLIAEAEELIRDVEVGTEEGQVPQEAMDFIENAVSEAKKITNNSDKKVIHQGYLALFQSMTEFRGYIASNLISLEGEWQLKLGPYAEGDADKILDDICILPGTLDENQKGNISSGFDQNKLNRKYKYTGAAVYQKVVYIPEFWEGKQNTLLLERTKLTRVWVNGVEQTECNTNDSIGTPQVYTLNGLIPGQLNTITIEVKNTDYKIPTRSHMLTEETVTNWNGMIGRMELAAVDSVSVDAVRCYPDIQNKTVTVEVTLNNITGNDVSGILNISAESYNHEGIIHKPEELNKSFSMKAAEKVKEFRFTYDMGDDVRLWSEFDPDLYHLTVSLDAESFHDAKTVSFGMREIGTKERKFTINGTKTFLRGEGNSAVFPLTGYPFMTKEEWTEFFKTAQELGINFFRFHSWTPPEAAFEAADELGVYMQPELYGFGEQANWGTNHYYYSEAKRILEHLANHPSFVMLALGNELDTDNAKKRANATALVNYCRELDDTRLYAEGSNNNYWNVSFNQDDDYWTTCKTVSGRDDKHIRISFSWADARSGGHIESTQPGTDFTYDKALAGYTKPIMNHEAGQYQVLPNFETEIPKYEPGIFEARNLMMYRDRMEKNGILHMNEKFSKASARLSAIGYRADMQTALLSNDLAGYQLLSIQDFPGQGTAHVGILDNFMDEKQGGYTKEQYKNFNDAAVVLGVLPKLVYTNDEILTGKIAIPNYTPENLGDLVGTWKLKDDEKILDEGKLDAVTAKQGEVTYLGEFSTNALGKVEKASHLTVEVAVSGALDNTNSYDIWVYPKKMDVTDAQNVVVSANWDEETQQALKDGKKVLLLPSPTKEVLPGSASVRWTTDYWSRMFHGNDGTVDYRAYTMGTYIEKEHPIFKNFPTEEYSDYQWFNLAKGSRALNLTNVPVDPLVWNIDHMEWGRKLGSLLEVNVESGKLVLCTFDLLGQMDQYPEAKQLYYSILEYMKSDEFIPKHTLSVKELSELVLEEKNGFDAYERIEAEEYMDSNSTGFKEEHGKSEDGNSETAVGGIRGSDWLAYRDVQFGEKGTTSITVNGANDSAYGNEKLELRLDSKDGPVVATLEFKKNGSWSTYKSQTFTIPRIQGVHDVYIKATVGAIAFNYFQFTESDVSYRNPYQQMDPEATDSNVVREGTMTVLQNYLQDITGTASITLPYTDFEMDGSGIAVICGRTKGQSGESGEEAENKGKAVSGKICYKDEEGMNQEIPFTFKPNEGEEYMISSERFWRQYFPAKGIKGVQDLKIIFNDDTLFDLESVYFMKDPVPLYKETLNRAKEIADFAKGRPRYYTEESLQNFQKAYDLAKRVDLDDITMVMRMTNALNDAIDSLVKSGVNRSAYETTYAKYYDRVNGKVNEEWNGRDVPAVGGFDKGEKLSYEKVDFGKKGACKLTVCGANGRGDTENEKDAVLRFWYGTGSNDYVDVEVKQTGGWSGAFDKEFSVVLDSAKFCGVKDITVELVSGAIALKSYIFEEVDNSEVTADKTLLIDLVNYAQSQQENEAYQYLIPIVKAAFEKALSEAIVVNENTSATQAEVDAVYDKLLHMVQYLDFTGNSESLKVLVDAANGLNEKLYTTDSWAVLNDAKVNAEEILADENALQNEIDVAARALQVAMEGLVKISVDKTKLEKLVDKSKKYEDKISEYTDTTAKIFTGALEHARNILAKEDAAQEEIDAAYAALQNTIFGLRLIPDKDKLGDLIKDAEKVGTANYTAESVEVFRAALENAKVVFADENATEEQVKAAEKALKKAQKNLVVKAAEDKKGNNKGALAERAAKTGDTAQIIVVMITILMAGLAAVHLFRRKTR